ncbi:MAG: adenosylcobinamide-GDP ribazoletransferase [Proteobacteria bacterium]|nr:adenosylcobinamide-GDP ribazoletransferase [Pseudomonadota bacterium]MBU4328589.1 adenosylcobinamide-GDP ribazoletransferase [Pseudomonadota bacterium]
MSEQGKNRQAWAPDTLKFPLASFLAALRFLTIVPLAWRCEYDGRFFAASLAWFPVIGLLIGLTCATLISGLISFFPPSVLAMAAIVLLAAISGCLHLDGLADSGDGLLSSRPRERILEIMRDSHTGAMGVIAIVVVLLGKYAALSSLGAPTLIATLIVMPLAGRCAIVVTMAFLPYAREGEGLGRLFYSPSSRWAALWSFALLAGVLSCSGWRMSLVVLVAVFTTVLLFSLWCRARIGGATGDTLGAVCELTEMMVAIAMTFGVNTQ